MKKTHDYQAAFLQEYPEIQSLNEGVRLDPEQAHQFSSIISGKIVELSRKPELNDTEKTFIDRTMDLGVRSVIYLSERYDASYPESEATRLVLDSINRINQGHEPLKDIDTALHSVTGSVSSTRVKPSLRMQIEDTARGAMHMFGEMVGASDDGAVLDNYLEGNLQNIVADFERVEQQSEF